MTDYAVSMKNVSACYVRGKNVLENASLDIPFGVSVSVVGINGSGKTTLLRAMCGMVDTSGTVTLAGHDISGMKRRDIARYVSVMEADEGGSPDFTVREAVAMGRYVHKRGIFGTDPDRGATERALCETGLEAAAEKKVTELSGGQRQRVYLARVFAQQTPIILLDEPMNFLDLKYRTELMEYLMRWKQGHTEVDGISYQNTLIGVHHDLSLARSMAEYMIFVKEGKILMYDKVGSIDLRDALKASYGMDAYAVMQEMAEYWK